VEKLSTVNEQKKSELTSSKNKTTVDLFNVLSIEIELKRIELELNKIELELIDKE